MDEKKVRNTSTAWPVAALERTAKMTGNRKQSNQRFGRRLLGEEKGRRGIFESRGG